MRDVANCCQSIKVTEYKQGASDDTLIIVGAGGHAKVAYEIASLVGFRDICFVASKSSTSSVCGISVLKDIPKGYRGSFFIAVGDNFQRRRLYSRFMLTNADACDVSLIHPSSVVSESATIGRGSIVMAGSVIASYVKIERCSVVNTRSSVDHESHLAEFSSIAPGVSIAGNVTVGRMSAVSIGSSVIHRVKIGAFSIVGAGSVVLSDVPSNVIAFGVPARTVRSRLIDEPYL